MDADNKDDNMNLSENKEESVISTSKDRNNNSNSSGGAAAIGEQVKKLDRCFCDFQSQCDYSITDG